jgi:hypothetical protein
MVDCPKLREARRQMRSKVGDAFNSVTVMLGGKPGGDPAKAKNWSIDRDMLNAVLDCHKDSNPVHRKSLSTRAEDKEHDTGHNEAQTSCMQWFRVQ